MAGPVHARPRIRARGKMHGAMLPVPISPVRLADTLTPTEAAQRPRPAARAAAADGVGPLSEQSGSPSPHRAAGPAPARVCRGAAQRVRPAGLGHRRDASGELVVDPDHRRRRGSVGAGRRGAGRGPRGPGVGARRAAGGRGAGRERRADGGPRAAQDGPPPTAADLDPAAGRPAGGFTARAFEPGRDEQAWLRTNAAAFAHHPEQGRLTLEDLQERMAQPWFDPAGFILVEAGRPPARSRPSTGPRSTRPAHGARRGGRGVRGRRRTRHTRAGAGPAGHGPRAARTSPGWDCPRSSSTSTATTPRRCTPTRGLGFAQHMVDVMYATAGRSR